MLLSCLTFCSVSESHIKHLGEVTLCQVVADKVSEILGPRIVTCFQGETCINWKEGCFYTVCICVNARRYVYVLHMCVNTHINIYIF